MLNLMRIPYSSILVQDVGVISEGDTVSFESEIDGTERIGVVISLKGKRTTKITISPEDSVCVETWLLDDIVNIQVLKKAEEE